MLAVGDEQGLTIYDHDRALARYEAEADEPIAAIASNDGKFVALDCRHRVVIWRRSDFVADVDRIPSSNSLRPLLQRSEMEAVLRPPEQAATQVPKPGKGSSLSSSNPGSRTVALG
jgi:hypothetical protein